MRGVGEREIGVRRQGLHYYSVGGRSADTAATSNHGCWCLWNPPSPPTPIWFISFIYSMTSATATFRPLFHRFLTRGTPGSTVTPDIDNDYERYVAPASGAVLDLSAYTVQPTVSGAGQTDFINRMQVITGAAENPMFYIPPKPIMIPPGEGYGAITAGNVICSGGDITVEWCE